MASFDDDNDPIAGSDEENEDEDMEDVDEADQDADQDMDGGGEGEDEEEENDDDNDDQNDNDEDEDEDQNDAGPSSRRASPTATTVRSPGQETQQNGDAALPATSPRQSGSRSPGKATRTSFIPAIRPEALTAIAYDIVPTMAAPQSTSINAIATTPDMRWVFSGGTDGYIRMYNWVETANGKVPLTVAQKHPFVDSVMKAGSLVTYWENEEHTVRTPTIGGDDSKWLSPVYSLAVQHQAVWLLSGLESGAINLQTCRHQAGTRIATLKEHTSAVSVLSLSLDETSLLSGSWDKTIHDWDLQTGKVKRSFRGAGGQISAIETRPISSVPIPEVVEPTFESLNGTFSSNNADKILTNGLFGDDLGGSTNGFKHKEDDAIGSPEGSLWADGDDLFGENLGSGGGGGGAGNSFEEDDDYLTRALENEMRDDGEENNDAPVIADASTDTLGHAPIAGDIEPGSSANADTEMMEADTNGAVQQPAEAVELTTDAPANFDSAVVPTEQKQDENELQTDGVSMPEALIEDAVDNGDSNNNDKVTNGDGEASAEKSTTVMSNGLPHSEEPVVSSTTNENEEQDANNLPQQSESTFLDAAIDGTLRIWDRRMPDPVAKIVPYGGTRPWCTGACWTPDGNFFYVGRKGCTVDEYSIHHLGSKRSEPNRVFEFPPNSGSVYAVRAMPNKKHLVCASNDILRIYDLAQAETRHKQVPFTIVPGHRGGNISSIYIDPTCRFMLTAAGNRGWEGSSNEVLLGYEIGIQDEKGVWFN